MVSHRLSKPILRVDLTFLGAILHYGDVGQPAVTGVSVVSGCRDCAEVFHKRGWSGDGSLLFDFNA